MTAALRGLDALQRRNRPLGFLIAVIYKFVDDLGGFLAALITYYAFLSLFPLLLLLTTGLSLVLANNPDLQRSLLDSALGDMPIIGEQLSRPRQLSGGTAGVVVGSLLALYGASGVGQAVQNAMNTVWSVPRMQRPNPFMSRLRSLRILLVLAVALAATAALSLVGNVIGSYDPLVDGVLTVAAIAINAAVFALAYQVGTERSLTFREVLPGGLAMAVVWQLLQTFGAYYVNGVVRHASATNSVFAVVLGLLAFLQLTALAVVFTAEINAVRVDRLWPRALLVPFTDDAELSRADRVSYAHQVQAQQASRMQRIRVSFDRRSRRSRVTDADGGD
ncbi:YihY/virulence factor BrkB family protein [Williamsia sp. CHRR-6]|uniref:YihY/virulence factor BrkB family protein n=1 Tax=Williamsia sp. CHRR-6 TaxID=2835871 RepID=UPI001BDB65A8|nr:YhjD/YihY/BrkB family envelope integrity protein [Williamsia sp. CHRR-6]MBT0566817.1 YihY/virulence factor BrkB family protein [Williamsia sp. CHRR-6]